MTICRLPSLVVAAALLGACKSDPARPPSEVLALSVQGGDEQSGPAGGVLDDPLQVAVKNAVGEPVRGAIVKFRPSAGTGVTLSDTVATTGIDGVARVDARLGPTPTAGPVPIAVALLANNSNEQESFRATVTPPPTLTDMQPRTIKAGDTVIVTGTNFNANPVGNTVFFGAARGRIIQVISPTQLRVVVPACITPGTVSAFLQIGSVVTNSISLSYAQTSPTIDLALFEAITVSGTELGNCLRLTGDSASYLIIPQFATAQDTLPIPYRLGNQETVPPLAAVRPFGNDVEIPLQYRLDAALRAIEARLAPKAAEFARLSRPMELQAEELNSTRNFRVLSNLPEGTEKAIFKTVTGRLKYIGTNILIYLDQNSPSGSSGFTDAELQQFGDLFDRDLYGIAVRAFGTESDVDNNDRVIVLMTPVVNGLTPKGACTSFVTGFFFGFDFSSSPDANRAEIFYSLVPDPAGQFSCAHSVDRIRQIVPATFIHEFQHMISYNQHVLVRGGSQETTWLNEGLSHIAEELASRHYESKFPPPQRRSSPEQLFPDSANPFMNGNLRNSYDYLASTPATSLTLFKSSGTLKERGAAWLFLRWLGDQKDSTVYGRLVQTRKTSVENVEDKTGETFTGLFGDWSIALWADSIVGHPRDAVNPRYRFNSTPAVTRTLRRLYQRLFDVSGGQIPRPFPIVLDPLPYNAEVTDQMVPGTMDFFRLQAPKSSASVGLLFARQQDPPGFDTNQKAQVGVLRLP